MSSFGPGQGSSQPERLLRAALLLFVAAFALRFAVQLFVSILWPLIGLTVVALLTLTAWRWWQSRRGGW